MDWEALIRVEPQTGAEKMADLTAEMAKLVDERPEIAPQSLELIGRHLVDGSDGETYTAVWEGIDALFGLGEDAPRLFSWLLATEQRERLDAVTAQCPPVLARLLRSCMGLYGQGLQEAYRRWREYPDNWDAMHRQVYVDIERNQNRIDITIVKYNQEQLELTLEARSLLLMVSRLMNSLSAVASGPFTDSELDELREQSDAFWRAIETNKVDAGAEVAEVVAANAKAAG
jgi:hypothetical protein